MTREQLENVQFRCHVATLDAIDDVLSDWFGERPFWITDSDLPALIRALDKAIEAALRRGGMTVEDEP
jgi:hypothetical protein